MRIDEVDEEEEGRDEEYDNAEQIHAAVSSATTSMAAVICHCRQLIPFLVLPRDFEKQCTTLFQTVYYRSCMGFNEKTKSIEVQVSNATFIGFRFCVHCMSYVNNP